MPTLFLSSNYSLESRRLRTAAEKLGWGTSRMDRPEKSDLERCPLPYAIYAPPKQALPLAKAINHKLLQCGPDWLPALPEWYRKRNVLTCTLADARKHLRSPRFVKPVRHGLFESRVYVPSDVIGAEVDSKELAQVADPLVWLSEFRCFIADRTILAIACYRHQGRSLADLDDRLPVSSKEIAAARAFCQSLLDKKDIWVPAGIVIDVGETEGAGWAVVEANEAWNSSIYGCPPEEVLPALLACCAHADKSPARVSHGL